MRLAKTNASAFDSMLVKRCSFLFDNYTDLFNKIKKDELDLTILGHFLVVLREIEEGRMDQHTGAYEVGKVLKRLYIDSAVTRADRLDSKHNKHSKPKKMPARRFRGPSTRQCRKEIKQIIEVYRQYLISCIRYELYRCDR